MVDRTPAPADALARAAPETVQATFCATLVDEWSRRGIARAVIAPGSRSTPMALALAECDHIEVHVVHDERVAAFTALGLGLAMDSTASPTPALLLCTSGTAAANFFPAVVEAGLSQIPMIVLTADRPVELRGVGAPQTIDQIELYGRHVRWFHDPGVPEAATASGWRRLAADAWRRCASGPIQLNLPFREPLVAASLDALPAELPSEMTSNEASAAGADDREAPPRSAERATDSPPAGFDRQRGVILAGGASGVDPHLVLDLHARTDWPIIADPLSGLRGHDGVITSADALLRHERFAFDHAPEVIVRIGRPATSKVLAQWSDGDGVTMIQVGGPGTIDPDHNVAAVCTIDTLLAAEPVGATGTTWLARWTDADLRADAAIAAVIDSTAIDPTAIDPDGVLTEPAVARTLAEHMPAASMLTVASSMPVRDLEWFGGRCAVAHSNRGANGIDGVISTALGRALARPSGSGTHFVLIGDLAFVHDSNALVGLVHRDVDLRIVVVDNDGGGIFSFLPQASKLTTERFEQLFGTPLGTDVSALAAAHGVPTATVTTRDELVEQIHSCGPWVARISTDRRRNVEVHAELNAAVAATLS